METYEELIETTTKTLEGRCQLKQSGAYSIPKGFTYRVINTALENFNKFVKAYDNIFKRLKADKNDYLQAFKNFCILVTSHNHEDIVRISQTFNAINKRYTSPNSKRLNVLILGFLNEVNVEIEESKIAVFIDKAFAVNFDVNPTPGSNLYSRHHNFTTIMN